MGETGCATFAPDYTEQLYRDVRNARCELKSLKRSRDFASAAYTEVMNDLNEQTTRVENELNNKIRELNRVI